MFCRVYYIRQDLVLYHLLACLAGAGLCFFRGKEEILRTREGRKGEEAPFPSRVPSRGL